MSPLLFAYSLHVPNEEKKLEPAAWYSDLIPATLLWFLDVSVTYVIGISRHLHLKSITCVTLFSLYRFQPLRIFFHRSFSFVLLYIRKNMAKKRTKVDSKERLAIAYEKILFIHARVFDARRKIARETFITILHSTLVARRRAKGTEKKNEYRVTLSQSFLSYALSLQSQFFYNISENKFYYFSADKNTYPWFAIFRRNE